MMGNVFKKTVARPLPSGAEIITRQGVRLARWRDGKGKIKTTPVTTTKDGAERIRDESSTYVARYRDGNNQVVEVSTGCRDKSAAENVLADLKKKAERVRSGLLTPADARTAEHLATPISEHFDAYLNALAATGCVPMHRSNVKSYLIRLAADCGFVRLGDLNREALEKWLARQTMSGRSARSRNTHRASLIAFANWCSDPNIGRLSSNPFKGAPKADEKADPRRRRRSMTEAELVTLLDVARGRPLLEAQTIRRGKRKGQTIAKVKPEVRTRLEAVGRERALIYKALALSGLRRNELASLSVAHLQRDGAIPYVELDVADEKNREGNDIVIRDDLAADLRAWLDDKLAALQAEAHRRGDPIPSRLPGDMPVFAIPDGLVRIFSRDLKLAGIAKRDERGRTLDVHALRMTFGTLLGKGGVPLRTTQAAMRHSDPKLTANVYTDPKLLDVRGALDALPSLPLRGGPTVERERTRATGTDAFSPGAVAPLVALNHGNGRQSPVTDGKATAEAPTSVGPAHFAVTQALSRDFTLPIGLARGDSSTCPAGFEPATSSFGGKQLGLPRFATQIHSKVGL
jgi:integrase